jgi:hypothetical protein
MSGTGERKTMTCAEFQEVLPFIFESGGDAKEMEHLKTCQVCSDLVQDLRYIADQAKLLLPLRDPSPKVWDNIQTSLEREGLVRPQAKAQSAGKKKVAETVVLRFGADGNARGQTRGIRKRAPAILKRRCSYRRFKTYQST